MCWVIPPCSPETTFVSLIESNKDVFPWSTWPITVTIGALFFKSAPSDREVLSIFISIFSSLIGLCPNSFIKYSAVSASIEWFIVAVTPILKRCLMRLLACSAILFANSRIVINFGTSTFLIIGLSFSNDASLEIAIFSFLFALLIDAKLLDLNPRLSSSKALERVSLYSLFLTSGLLLITFSSTICPLALLVALCSASFLFSESLLIKFKSLLKILPVLVTDLTWSLLNCWFVFLNPDLIFFFSIITEFLFWLFAYIILSDLFLVELDTDKVNFFLKLFFSIKIT